MTQGIYDDDDDDDTRVCVIVNLGEGPGTVRVRYTLSSGIVYVCVGGAAITPYSMQYAS